MQANQMVQSRQTFSFTPTSLEEAERFASIIAKSSICPSALANKPGDVLVILQTGYEMGLKPMQSLRTLGCINGVAFAWGDGLLALVKRHPDFVDIKEWFEGEGMGLTAHCTITRRNQTPQTRTFSMMDATKAQLTGKKGPWQQYPRRMLQHRARGFCCKDVFPDALYGLYSENEAQEINEARNAPVQKPMGRGIAGMKEAMGITKEPEVIEASEVRVVDGVTGELTIIQPETDPLDELKLLVAQNSTDAAITVTLRKFGVNSMEELTPDMIEKWTNHLLKKGAR